MTKNKQAVLDFQTQLAQQMVGHHIGPQSPEVYGQKPTNYVFASNGVFRVIKNSIGVFKTKESELPEDFNIPGIGEMEAGVDLLIPKIPFEWWLKILKFYRDINKEDGCEASNLFFWNHNNVSLPTHYNPTESELKMGKERGAEIKGLTEQGQLIIYTPIQTNSASLSSFEDDPMVDWLRKHTSGLLEVHSH